MSIKEIAFAVCAALLGAAGSGQAAEQAPVPDLLWPGGVPGAVGDDDADRPSLTYFPAPAEKATGASVVVCPGGGYQNLALDHEGKQIVAWLNERGMAAFLLRYRLSPRYRYPAMLRDAQRAVRMARAGAARRKLDPQRIGMWGFSAGGHLTAMAATHFDEGNPDAADPVERASCRPDFAILCYPAILMADPFTPADFRARFLGANVSQTLLDDVSPEKNVTARTPPAFLFHTTTDPVVPPENSIAFYLALRKAGVPAEMHLYEQGRHGVGLAQKDPVLSTWPSRLEDWLRARGAMAGGK